MKVAEKEIPTSGRFIADRRWEIKLVACNHKTDIQLIHELGAYPLDENIQRKDPAI